MSCQLFSSEGVNWWLLIALMIAYPLFKWVLTVIYEVVKQLLPKKDILKRYCRSDKQSWAVVTGATDGIGLGFCQVLAGMGFNIVLISRNPEKLAKTVKSLQSYQKDIKGQLKTIAFDFKDSSNSQKYNKMVAELRLLDIGLFINNVGTSDAKLYHNYSYEQIVETLNINCVGMATLCAQILGLMRRRSHKSALINLSSYMEEKALPYLSLYAATKAFNKNLTEGLSYEYPEIDILCLKPMFVETPLSRQKKGFTIPDRRECAADSLQELVWQKQSYGYISHRIVGSVSKILIPDWAYRFGVKHFTKLFLVKIYPEGKFD